MKRALLQMFHLTTEGFRDKFRGARPDKEETGTQYGARLSCLFDRWLDLTKTPKESAVVRYLLLMEQFVHSVSAGMSLFLRERDTPALEYMAGLADRYLQAQEQETVP